MKKILSLLVVLLCLVCAPRTAKAQAIAIRTNLAEWGLMAPNMGVDFVLNEFSSVSISVGATAGEIYFKDAKVQHGQLEYRYWFSQQPYENFFLGLQFTPAHYSMRLHHNGQDVTHTGVAAPFGFNFGYSWPLTSKFNLEACYGAGWIFYNNSCSLAGASHNKAFSTTNFGVNITYILK